MWGDLPPPQTIDARLEQLERTWRRVGQFCVCGSHESALPYERLDEILVYIEVASNMVLLLLLFPFVDIIVGCG